MTQSLLLGVLAGAGTIVVSEWLMLRSKTSPVKDFWKLSLSTTVLRSICVVIALVAVVGTGRADPAPFTLALITVYWIGLLFEAGRYRRRIESR